MELSGDEIERVPMPKWAFVLFESFRENGKVRKRQWHVLTLRFWEIVDDHIARLKRNETVVEGTIGLIGGYIYHGLERHFSNPEEQDRLYQLVGAKYEPIRERDKGQGRKKAGFESYRTFTFGGGQADDITFDLGGIDRDLARKLIESGYRSLAKTYHPDAGGSNEKMRELSELKEKMLESL